jgi:hypothetical protein
MREVDFNENDRATESSFAIIRKKSSANEYELQRRSLYMRLYKKSKASSNLKKKPHLGFDGGDTKTIKCQLNK